MPIRQFRLETGLIFKRGLMATSKAADRLPSTNARAQLRAYVTANIIYIHSRL